MHITVSESQEEVCHSGGWTQIIWYVTSLHPMQLLCTAQCTDIELKKASKMFAQHFSCGSSVTGEDEVVVQGDVYDGIIDFIQDKWPQASISFELHIHLTLCIYTGD